MLQKKKTAMHLLKKGQKSNFLDRELNPELLGDIDHLEFSLKTSYVTATPSGMFLIVAVF